MLDQTVFIFNGKTALQGTDIPVHKLSVEHNAQEFLVFTEQCAVAKVQCSFDEKAFLSCDYNVDHFFWSQFETILVCPFTATVSALPQC